MTKTEKKVAELEKRVKELEARPAIVVLPAPVLIPYAPPFNPWYPYGQVTCSGDGVSYTGGNTGVVTRWAFR